MKKFSKSKINKPMLSYKIPDIPFYKIAIYIVEYRGKMYLVIEDWDTVIEFLKERFGRLVILKTIVADNIPLFGSYKFSQFSKE